MFFKQEMAGNCFVALNYCLMYIHFRKWETLRGIWGEGVCSAQPKLSGARRMCA